MGRKSRKTSRKKTNLFSVQGVKKGNLFLVQGELKDHQGADRAGCDSYTLGLFRKLDREVVAHLKSLSLTVGTR